MTDVPELILTQLATLLGEMSGVQGVYRDRGDLVGRFLVSPTSVLEELPAVLLLQGGSDLTMDPAPLKSRLMPPAIFALKPEIYIICKPHDDATNLTRSDIADPIYTELSDWRVRVDAAVMNDPTLISILGSSGQIIFHGYETDMRNGGELLGMMQMRYEFRYLWTPSRG